MDGKAVPCGFTVVIDDREKLPYEFTTLRSNVRQGGGLLLVPIVRKRLAVGDYSILGHEDTVVIERKSLDDLYQSLPRRANFIGRLVQMNQLQFAAVVIEATWLQIASEPPFCSRMNPLSVVRSLLAWTVRYPHVHWIPAGSRAAGEAITYRLLEAFHRDHIKCAQT
jgi:DNA excision repair protein ERCC-4